MRLRIVVDGRPVRARETDTVAAALMNSGVAALRASVGGQPRGPLCAMGICFECRVTIDGRAHRRACLELCRADMKIETRG
jgi:D-hydroxyproline dehydrogenase subunit gamma